MKIVIPLAGKGTRLKPFTLSKAKAMVEVAGKPVLDHILQKIIDLKDIHVDEVIFIIGYMGDQIKAHIQSQELPFTCTFVEQKELMGQAHAIRLAKEHITSDCLIWFVDTISDANLDELAHIKEDGAIYVKEVADPRRFGQVKEEEGVVTKIEEKADPPISPLVNIGLYYVKDYKLLLDSIDELIDKDMKRKGEFYLMDVFELMIGKGTKFRTLPIKVWVDCGMPDAFLKTNRYLLGQEELQHATIREGVQIIPPVYIHDSAEIEDASIGPNVAIGKNSVIKGSVIKNSIIMDNCLIDRCEMEDSMIGENSCISDKKGNVILGPFSKVF